MPRGPRHAPGGVAYHVFNRANGKLRLFKKDDDYLAFEQALLLAHEHVPGARVLAWCVMPNHWHLVLWPRRDGELSAFVQRLSLTHAQRWKHAHDAVGHGHLYQGRFKSFPVQDDHHLLTVLRYVERNPLRAKLTKRAEEWRWGSCFARQQRAGSHALEPLLGEWPVERPRRWLDLVNAPPRDEAEEATLAEHITRDRPYGDPGWTQATARRLNLAHTLRPRGRPVGWRKAKPGEKPAADRK